MKARILAALRRLGIVYDEPFILTVDDAVVAAMNDGASLVVGFHHPPMRADVATSTTSCAVPALSLVPKASEPVRDDDWCCHDANCLECDCPHYRTFPQPAPGGVQ